jgi:cyclic-di-GMP-binding protein
LQIGPPRFSVGPEPAMIGWLVRSQTAFPDGKHLSFGRMFRDGAAMPSFDVVSKVDLMELDNALNTAQKELSQRYDFRGTNTTLERTPEGIILRTSDEPHATSALTVLRERMAKRNVSQKCLDIGDPEAATGKTVRVLIKIKQGIETETAKKISKTVKDSKLKVQAAIQGDELRVTGKNKDDLQAAIALLRREDFGIDLQFVNFRD